MTSSGWQRQRRCEYRQTTVQEPWGATDSTTRSPQWMQYMGNALRKSTATPCACRRPDDDDDVCEDAILPLRGGRFNGDGGESRGCAANHSRASYWPSARCCGVSPCTFLFTHGAVIVAVGHIAIRGVATPHRGNAMPTGFGTGNPTIAVVVVLS